MKTILLTVVTSLLTTLAVVWGVYNYASIPVGEMKFGSTIVNITGTDKLKDFPTAYNTTVNSLNATKLEISAFAATTSQKNLVEIGTITTGTWNATRISVPYGGTGWATIASGTVMFGRGTSGIGTTTAGSDGQVLALLGGTPNWSSVSVNQTLDYTWTGLHSFSRLATFSSTTVATTTATYVSAASLWSASSTITNATTTSLKIAGLCIGCANGHEIVSTSTTLVQDNNTQSLTATCSAGKVVIGGGYADIVTVATNGSAEWLVLSNYPPSTSQWSTSVRCSLSGGSCNVGTTFKVYAVCVNP
jgi:hypothetical protein